eukprot:scaffold133363_cov89-Phaeocystis_antarctica.AAC.1
MPGDDRSGDDRSGDAERVCERIFASVRVHARCVKKVCVRRLSGGQIDRQADRQTRNTQDVGNVLKTRSSTRFLVPSEIGSVYIPRVSATLVGIFITGMGLFSLRI